MKHTLELDDLELTALMTHLQGQSEVMNESRLNSSTPHSPDREEILLNMIYANVFTLAYEADKNPKVDYNIIENQDRIYKYS
tara:strand:- start:383 stop:628 length:246 start_codon:yes stop_codon:yes gene_type:complete